MDELLSVSDILSLLRHLGPSSFKLQTVERDLSGDDLVACIVVVKLPGLGLLARRLAEKRWLLPLLIRQTEGLERVVDGRGHHSFTRLIEFDVNWPKREGVLDQILGLVQGCSISTS